MSVGVTKDYKLKVKNLHASHTLFYLKFISKRIKKRAEAEGNNCHAKTMCQ